jgi:hypothetical protein
MPADPVISALTEMLGRIPYDYEIDYHCYSIILPITRQEVWFWDNTPFAIIGT